MFKKLLKKLAVAATLACMVTTVAATAAACNIETDHPEVRITVEFNGESYKLDYKLYRNMYPNTVRHFIELAENGVYNNMLVHDYRNNDWYSGGYEYDEDDYTEVAESEADGASFVDYFINHSVEEKYMELFNKNKLTVTVYGNSKPNGKDIDKDTRLPTLIGEFYDNIKQEIKKGALSAEKGALKMYYYGKETANKVYVKPTDDQMIMADYKTNCATTLFSMQVGVSSTLTESKYCVFGKMESMKNLNLLVDAVKEYCNDHDLFDVNDVPVDNQIDSYAEQYLEDIGGGVEADFTLPALPIIIKSVKVTKY